MLICVDLDWTLCEANGWWDKESCLSVKPLQDRIDKVNQLVMEWNFIIIFTARSPELFKETMAWLLLHNVSYHWINMQRKPWADLYIDDKAINANDYFKRAN